MSRAPITHGHASVEDFFYWINERHRIYLLREVECTEPPWTEDEILQEYKFTNAFRQLDRGTRWLTDHIIGRPSRIMDLLLFNIVTYRMYNLWTAQQRLGYITDWPTHRDRWLALDPPIFTGAHMTVGAAGQEKKVTYAEVWDELWPLRFKLLGLLGAETTLEGAFDTLLAFKIYGIGKFIAYEIVSDLRWTPILADATDKTSWANIGPGCARGLRRLGMPETVESLRELYMRAPEYLDHHVMQHYPLEGWSLEDGTIKYPPFEMREIEHSLCEFDKYQRVKTGGGRPRSKFHGGFYEAV